MKELLIIIRIRIKLIIKQKELLKIIQMDSI